MLNLLILSEAIATSKICNMENPPWNTMILYTEIPMVIKKHRMLKTFNSIKKLVVHNSWTCCVLHWWSQQLKRCNKKLHGLEGKS